MSKAILIIIDGCRPDAIRLADTPHIHKLMLNGTYTLEARTVKPSITLPVHFSIFTGLKPIDHGVLTNTGRPGLSLSALSFFTLAKYAGKTTASFYNWEYLRELSPPGYLDNAFHINNNGCEHGDRELAEVAARHLVNKKPDFSFIYLGCLDQFGHDYSFMSDEYLKALERADQAVGLILDATGHGENGSEFNIILHSDHGGCGMSHEEDRPENVVIPWMAVGPNIKANLQVNRPISVLDTAPTLACLLGMPPSPAWQGRVVEEIFE
jgi:predicted AlkP superfamily pyrophosphatase or phosphodiesterase